MNSNQVGCWTPVQTKLLTDLRKQGYSNKFICQKLGRSKHSIRIKISRLGLAEQYPLKVGRIPIGLDKHTPANVNWHSTSDFIEQCELFPPLTQYLKIFEPSAILCGDLHLPYINVQMWKNLLAVRKKTQTDTLILAGDTTNQDAFSHYVNEDSRGSFKKERYIVDMFFDEALSYFKRIYLICLSEDTKVLTKNGWKYYNELLIGEDVLSLNTNTDQLEYTPIQNITINDFNGDMVNIKTASQDQLLTPDHKVLCFTGKSKYKYKSAKELLKLKKNSMFFIPAVRQYVDEQSPIYRDDEIKLMAWIITEGSFLDNKRGIQITQSIKNNKNIQEIKELLASLNIKYSIYEHKGRKERVNEKDWIDFYLFSNDVKKYRKILQDKKEISRELLNLNSSQLKTLFDTLLKGDGHISNSTTQFYTSLYNLAEQFLELSIKIGYTGSITKRERIMKYKGYEKPVDVITYTVCIHKAKDRTILTRNIKTKYYEGKVFCITNKNHNFMAMRNGKIFITGNCGNHDMRFFNVMMAELEAPQFFKIFTDQIGKKIYVSGNYRFCEFNKHWRITHPKNYGRISTRVAESICIKKQKHVASGHGHLQGWRFDPSGKYLAADIGCLNDALKIPYTQMLDSTNPNWNYGFMRIESEFPEFYNLYITNWNKYK